MSCYFKKTIGFAILISLSIVFPAIFVQAAAPLTLKASAAEAPKTQTQPQKTAQSGGTSGGKQIDPFRKSETTKNVEKRPNLFQDLLDRQVELPTKKRPPAPPKKKADITNPFEEAEEGVSNPFEDAEATGDSFGDNPFGDNPFGDDGSGQFGATNFDPSNPFAAGDPFADEGRVNQVVPQTVPRDAFQLSGRSPSTPHGMMQLPEPSPETMLRKALSSDVDVLNIPGGPSILAPEKGYVWIDPFSMDVDGIKEDTYICVNVLNPQTGVVLTLTVGHHEAQNDDTRCLALKGHYNSLYNSINNPNFTIGNTTRPNTTSPVPNVVSYAIQAKRPDGSDFYMMATTVFSKKTFMVAAGTPTKAESQRIMDSIVKSLQEDAAVYTQKSRIENQDAFPKEAVKAPEAQGVEVLKIPGGPSIPAPEEWYVWVKTFEADQLGIKVETYSCDTPRGRCSIRLNIEYREVKADEIKLNILKTQYDDLYYNLKNMKATIINETRPNKNPPIPKTVSYAIHGKNTQGSTSDIFMMKTTIFSKNTYTVSVSAGTQAEAQKFLDAIVKSILKE